MTWFPEPLPEPRTGREAAEQAVASDYAGTVEAADWSVVRNYTDQAQDAWDDTYLTEDDRRMWR